MTDFQGPDHRQKGDYPEVERRRDPDDHTIVRVIRDEIKYQIGNQNQFLEQRFTRLEEGQCGLQKSHILIREKQEAFQREIDGWKAGAKWVNYAAIVIAAILVALAKAWDWITSHVAPHP